MLSKIGEEFCRVTPLRRLHFVVTMPEPATDVSLLRLLRHRTVDAASGDRVGSASRRSDHHG